ncbi:MAG TPA: hypothetical protein VNC61_10750 [Acidimicrobiales bacterium]|nr:hypothetical protein [Acidimicrobiales bacterium]
MTDPDQTVLRLRSAVDELVTNVPAVAPSPALVSSPVSVGRVPAGRRRGWQRPLALISIAVAAASVVAALMVSFGPRSTPPTSVAPLPVKPIGVADAPPGWITLPFLLPPADAVIDNATVVTGPVPVPNAGTYEQVYRGPDTINPAQLLITTVLARAGALADYASESQTLAMDGTTAYMTNGHHRQLLWQTADGVVVSLESTGMTSSDLVAAGQRVAPRPAAQLGVDVSGVLPDGLVFAGEGFASGDTGQNQDTVFFHVAACHAYAQVWAGSAADFAPVAIVSDATRIVSIGGTRVLSVRFGSTSALLWNEGPGIDVRLQGSGCDLSAIAAGIRVVDSATWTSEISSLGTKATSYAPRRPPASATLPGPGTYGLAH